MTKTMPERAPIGEIAFIQIMRGVAALGVLIAHAGRPNLSDPSARHVVEAGVAGVDLFFMISGFIMFHTIPEAKTGLSYATSFAIKRVARVWPVYAVWTLIFVGLLALFTSVAPDIVQVTRSLFFFPTDRPGLPPQYTKPVLDVGWTLYYEIYFYLVLTACLLAGRARWLVFGAWLVVALVIVPIMQHRFTLDPNLRSPSASVWINTLTSPIMWEFPAGMLIAWLYRHNIRLRHEKLAWFLFVISIAWFVAYSWFTVTVLHGLTHAAAPLFAMLLCMSWLPIDLKSHVARLFHWSGRISFSLYLAHRSVMKIFGLMLLALMLRHGVPAAPALPIIGSLASLVVAAWSYRVLERGLSNRIRDALLRWTARRALNT